MTDPQTPPALSDCCRGPIFIYIDGRRECEHCGKPCKLDDRAALLALLRDAKAALRQARKDICASGRSGICLGVHLVDEALSRLSLSSTPDDA